MRLSLGRTTALAVTCLWAFACASGAADQTVIPGTPGTTTTGSATSTPTGTATGTATTPGTDTTAAGGSTSTTGTAATGGALTATTVAQCATEPSPVSAWKSLAACDITSTVLEAEYTAWRNAFFVDCGDGEAYVLNTQASRIVSEGIGYGMLIAVNLGKAEDFKKLAAFYLARLNSNNLMKWKFTVGCDTSAEDSNSATDADIDAALAMIIATKKALAGDSAYTNYTTQITTALTAIKAHEVGTCGYVLPGETSWASCSRLNPSYFAPGHFRVFADFSGDSSWDTLADNVYTLLSTAQSSFNGLVSDWVDSSGAAVADLNITSRPRPCYGYEACRVPWRIALDYGWFLSPSAKTFLMKIKTSRIDPVTWPVGVVTGVDTGDTTPAGEGWRPSYENNSCHKGGYTLVGSALADSDITNGNTAQYTYNSWSQAWLVRTWAGDAGNYYATTARMLYLITAAGQFDSGL